MVACLIDCLLVLAVGLVGLLPLLRFAGGLVSSLLWLLALLLVFCVVYTLYVAPLDGLLGGTLGKRLLGVEVVSVGDGGRPGLARAALRALTFLSTDGFLGLFVVLASPARRRPGDLLTETAVVRRRR